MSDTDTSTDTAPLFHSEDVVPYPRTEIWSASGDALIILWAQGSEQILLQTSGYKINRIRHKLELTLLYEEGVWQVGYRRISRLDGGEVTANASVYFQTVFVTWATGPLVEDPRVKRLLPVGELVRRRNAVLSAEEGLKRLERDVQTRKEELTWLKRDLFLLTHPVLVHLREAILSHPAERQPEIVAQINGWLARGDGVAVYQNNDLGHPDLGLYQIVSYGSGQAQLEYVDEPPHVLPDIGGNINWRYTLVCQHRGLPIIDSPERFDAIVASSVEVPS